MGLDQTPDGERVRPDLGNKPRLEKVSLIGAEGSVNAALHVLFSEQACDRGRFEQDAPTDLDPCRQQLARHVVVSCERHSKPLRTPMQ